MKCFYCGEEAAKLASLLADCQGVRYVCAECDLTHQHRSTGVVDGREAARIRAAEAALIDEP